VADDPGSGQSKRPSTQSSGGVAERPTQDDRGNGNTAQPPQRSRFSRGRRGYSPDKAKNHEDVKGAFVDVAKQASAGTVQILADGDAVALGTTVSADGYIVSKASLLAGKLLCRLKDGSEFEATVIGTDEEHDLALLKVPADDLTTVVWCNSNPSPGSLVAAIGMDDHPLALGVVSTEPRTISGPIRSPSQRGWLGITLGSGASGLGIKDVSRPSAAAEAGLREGDLIVNVHGTAMKSVEQIVETIGRHDPGDALTLLIRRGEKEMEVSAKLGKRPSPQDNWGGGPFSERRTGFPLALPHDVIVPPDQCGGPLVDTSGKVVGINIARALRVTTYALPAQTVQEIVDKLRAAREE
jgi:serine protease Do